MKQPHKQALCVPFLNMNNQYMVEALKEANLALQQNEVPIGAVVVYNGEIIGRGHNTRENSHKVTNHAEIIAINQACENLKSWKLDDCSIYVTTEPCLMCAGTIIQARIKHVYYGCSDRKQGAFGSICDFNNIQGLNHYPFVHTGVMESQCKELLQKFFINLRQK